MRFKRLIYIIIAVIAVSTLINLYNPMQVQAAVSSIDRLDGSDRYRTAVKISQHGWDRSDAVVVATGEDYPDALCAAPLAKKYNAPILLVGSSQDSISLVLEEVKRLGADSVYLIGGTGVIPEDVENKIKMLVRDCVRIGGEDRFQTSAMIAERLGETEEAVIVTGYNYPDALSIAPIAALKSIPILLSSKDLLPDSIDKYIKARNISKWYVIGGSGAVGDSVCGSLKNAERIYGDDRYGTNTAVLNRFFYVLDFSTTYVATGENYPDALAGSALAPLTSSPLLLTDKTPYDETLKFIKSVLPSINVVNVLGGEGVVPEKTVADMTADAEYYNLAGQKSYMFTQSLVLHNSSSIDIQNVELEIYLGNLSSSPYQTGDEIAASGPEISIATDQSGEKKAVVNLSSLSSGQTVEYTITRTFKNSGINYLTDISRTSGDYTGFDQYAMYTSPAEKIESDNPLIKQKAEQIVKGEKNPYIKARKIFEYVNTALAYDYDEANKGALNALQTKKGVCEDFADLFAALARASGVPARVVSGFWVQDMDELNSGYDVDAVGYGHAWAEFYIPEYGWIPLETTYIKTDRYDNRVPAYEVFASLEGPGHIITGYGTEIAYSLRYKHNASVEPEIYVDAESSIKRL